MTLSLLSFLCIGVTSASLNDLGTVFVVIDRFIMWVKGSAIISPPSLKNLAGNLSGPALLLVFSSLSSRSSRLGILSSG